ncbi:MAG TPA: (d)CMP kinase [Solirubrobacteraceae bacterium]|nr:(d)CMP kinase [Solirubrobacteraceae bacterium]
MLVAIDGPAGAGKSTVARALADELGFSYLDSGALYRSVALLALQAPQADPAQLAREARIEFDERSGAGRSRVLLDGRDVTSAIRAPEVAAAASRVAAEPAVRAALLEKQRALLACGDWVAEGRDIGTVVAPGAELKVFLTAGERERARRRAVEQGEDPDAVLAELAARDERDRSREVAPLKPARDAVQIDTSSLTAEEVMARVATLARAAAGREVLGKRPPPGHTHPS